jgi:tetratricopeptide (TPR) repeat protein
VTTDGGSTFQTKESRPPTSAPCSARCPLEFLPWSGRQRVKLPPLTSRRRPPLRAPSRPCMTSVFAFMQADPSSHSFFPSLCQRFQSLIWLCLDADLTKSAVFHAERYFAIDPTNHDSRHLYAIALLREGQTYSALNLVNSAVDNQCTGCFEIKARCCTVLGRHRHAREALEATLQDTGYVNSGASPLALLFTSPHCAIVSSASRIAHQFPEEAALQCRAGNMALKGNLPEKASRSFREALSSNPYIWEAFEGLCSLGEPRILHLAFRVVTASLQGPCPKSMMSSLRDRFPSKRRRKMKDY